MTPEKDKFFDTVFEKEVDKVMALLYYDSVS